MPAPASSEAPPSSVWVNWYRGYCFHHRTKEDAERYAKNEECDHPSVGPYVLASPTASDEEAAHEIIRNAESLDMISVAGGESTRNACAQVLSFSLARRFAEGKAAGWREAYEERTTEIASCHSCESYVINPQDDDRCPSCGNELNPVTKLISDGCAFQPF